MAGRTCMAYVNSQPLVRGHVSVHYQVLASPGPCPRARARPAPRGRATGRGPAREEAADGEGRRGKGGQRQRKGASAAGNQLRRGGKRNTGKSAKKSAILRRKGVDCLGKGEIASSRTRKFWKGIPYKCAGEFKERSHDNDTHQESRPRHGSQRRRHRLRPCYCVLPGRRATVPQRPSWPPCRPSQAARPSR
jgi:hypothetical protein